MVVLYDLSLIVARVRGVIVDDSNHSRVEIIEVIVIVDSKMLRIDRSSSNR